MMHMLRKLIMLFLLISFNQAYPRENLQEKNEFYVDSLKQNTIPLYYQSELNQEPHYYGEISHEPFEFRSLSSSKFFPVDISFFIADAKYDEGKLKILEFGEGPRSRFKGYDSLYGSGKMWEHFWRYLKQFNLPIWYINSKKGTEENQKEIGFKELERIKGITVNNLEELFENEEFQRVAQQEAPKDKHKIREYKGIIIFRHQNASNEIIEEFKKNFPYFIVVDNASSLHVNNKYLTSLLFNDNKLLQYRPQCKSYIKQYSPSISSKIIRDFHSNTYVIKPLTAFKGNGVIIVRKESLGKVLYNILKKTQLIKRSKNPTYHHWARDRNEKFIVEEYEASKYIQLNGKTYDPTMRMVFCLHYDEGKIYLTFLDGYWKLPQCALEERGTLIEKTKSKIVHYRPSSARISHEDMKNAQVLFKNVLPLVYLKMLKTFKISRVRHLPNEPVPYLRSMGSYK